MKYIDADKLIAEVDRQEIGCNTDGKHRAEYNTCRKILDIIASLQQEQPEVGLDNHTSMEEIRKCGCNPNEFDIARHFYELGLNARKEE